IKVVKDPAPRLRALRPDAPPALDDLLDRMLAKSPDARPRDGAAVAAELAAMVEMPPPPSIGAMSWQGQGTVALPSAPEPPVSVRQAPPTPQSVRWSGPTQAVTQSGTWPVPASQPASETPRPAPRGGRAGLVVIGAVLGGLIALGAAAALFYSYRELPERIPP